METKIYKKNEFAVILQQIQAGKVLAFPTDTVFGVGVQYGNMQALESLKQAKDRDANKPIPVMVNSIKQMQDIAFITPRIKCIVDHFMPGGLTLVLKRKDIVDGLDTVAIRMPDDDFLKQLLVFPMYVTSANLSGEIPGMNEIEVLKQLNGRIDGIVQGKTKSMIASTIVDLSKNELVVLRQGEIPFEEIQHVWEEFNENSSSQ